MTRTPQVPAPWSKHGAETKDPRDAIVSIVAAWFREQSANPYGAFYLYMKPAPNGSLTIAETAPDGYELAESTRISPAWDIPMVEYKVRDWSRRLPILG